MTDISSRVALKRSHQMVGYRQLLLGVGLWLALGLFALYGTIVGRAGAQTGWLYLLTGLLFLPTVLSHLELRSWITSGGGSYRLVSSLERNNLTFIIGWMYLLGWAAVSALIALAFANYTSLLIVELGGTPIDDRFIAGGLLIILTISLWLNVRPPHRLTAAVVIGVASVIVLIIVVLLIQLIIQGESPAVVTTGSGRFAEGLGIAAASMWILETLTMLQGGRQRSLRESLLGMFTGPLLAGLFVLAAWLAIPPARSLEAIANSVLPGTGRPMLLITAVVFCALMLYVAALAFVRQLQTIGADGCFALWVLERNGGIVPRRLVTLMALLSLTAVAFGGLVSLAQLATLVLLLLQIGTNLAALILARQARSSKRGLILPLWPSIPASGAAVSFLLFFTLPIQVIAVGLIWVLLGIVAYLQYGRESMRQQQVGVIVFQREDIRSPFPVLVPVANPETAGNLVLFGAEVAEQRGGHLVLLQIIVAEEAEELEDRRAQAEEAYHLLERSAEGAAQFEHVEVETITRLARSVQQGIIDTISEEEAALLVVGWPGHLLEDDEEKSAGFLQEVIDNAPCDVAIVHGEWRDDSQRVMVPVSGGPHAPLAAQFGLAVTSTQQGKVTLLNVAPVGADAVTIAGREEALTVTQRLIGSERVEQRIVRANSPLEGILAEAANYDGIMLGASGSPFFIEQNVFGKFQLDVARQAGKPIALIRAYTGFGNLVARQTWQSLSDMLPTLSIEEQVGLLERMRAAAVPSVNYFVLIILSAMIATLGLLLNSGAVIIGAMLVAPLMSPIVASGMGIVRGDTKTFQQGLTSTLQGLLASVFLAILLTLIAPVAAATPEVMARTQPTLLDMMVALVSGAAGAYAIGRTEVGAALPGVAIAAALMPPICTIGIGIALGRVDMAGGALLLFVTNLFSIIVAAALVFMLLGVRPPQSTTRQRQVLQSLRFSLIMLAAVSLPLAGILFNQVRQDQFRGEAEAIIIEYVTAVDESAELVDLSMRFGLSEVAIDGTLYSELDLTEIDLAALEGQLNNEVTRQVTLDLFVLQGTRLRSAPDG